MYGALHFVCQLYITRSANDVARKSTPFDRIEHVTLSIRATNQSIIALFLSFPLCKKNAAQRLRNNFEWKKIWNNCFPYRIYHLGFRLIGMHCKTVFYTFHFSLATKFSFLWTNKKKLYQKWPKKKRFIDRTNTLNSEWIQFLD